MVRESSILCPCCKKLLYKDREELNDIITCPKCSSVLAVHMDDKELSLELIEYPIPKK